MSFTTEESEEESEEKKKDGCIVCGEKADYCIRGIPEDKYCKECADELFGLDALDKL